MHPLRQGCPNFSVVGGKSGRGPQPQPTTDEHKIFAKYEAPVCVGGRCGRRRARTPELSRRNCPRAATHSPHDLRKHGRHAHGPRTPTPLLRGRSQPPRRGIPVADSPTPPLPPQGTRAQRRAQATKPARASRTRRNTVPGEAAPRGLTPPSRGLERGETLRAVGTGGPSAGAVAPPLALPVPRPRPR